MLNFKQYLQEAKVDFAPWHITTGELKPEWEGKIKPNKDGTYKVSGYFSTNKTFGEDADKFPIKLSSAADSIDVSGKFTSLWGFPDKVKNAAWINCSELEHLDHVKASVGELSLQLPKLKSIEPNMFTCKILTIRDIGEIKLSEIIKKVNITSTIYVAENYLFKHRKILSLLTLPVNIDINFPHYGDTNTPNEYWKEARQVQDIIHKFRNNILDCQEALMDAGLEEYAQL